MQSLQIKLFDTSLPLPAYQTVGAAGFDLVARTTVVIQPRQVELVPLNVAIKPPTGHWILLAARSSLHKSGLQLINGVGIGDEDYCGNDDEYKAALFNRLDSPVTVERGQRIVQAVVLPRLTPQITRVESFPGQNRGGFGSTG